MRTWTRVAVTAGVALVLVGGAGAAVALSSAGGAGTTAAPTPTATGGGERTGEKAGKKSRQEGGGLAGRLLRTEHATWVTGRDGAFTTHQAIRGTVTAVSAESISVKAADGVSMTFATGRDTKVRARSEDGKGRGTSSSLTTVRTGATVAVSGVGAEKPAARLVLVGATPG